MEIHNPNFITELREKINETRNIKPSSLDSYIFNIEKLHEKIHGNKNIESLSFLNDYENIMKHLEDLKISTKKTYFAAIVVALMALHPKSLMLDNYRTIMSDFIAEYVVKQKTQMKSDAQVENWVDWNDLKTVPKKYLVLIKKQNILNSDHKWTKSDMDLLQRWMISSLYVLDDENPPPRNEYANTEIIKFDDFIDLSQEDKEMNNYLVIKSRNKKFFNFGNYKTNKVYGQRKIELSPKINSIINIYLKYHKDKYLLKNSRGGPMTPNGLTKFLNKTFSIIGKDNISSTMLRHIYISKKLDQSPYLEEKEQIAMKMGHSINTQELYRKK